MTSKRELREAFCKGSAERAEHQLQDRRHPHRPRRRSPPAVPSSSTPASNSPPANGLSATPTTSSVSTSSGGRRAKTYADLGAPQSDLKKPKSRGGKAGDPDAEGPAGPTDCRHGPAKLCSRAGTLRGFAADVVPASASSASRVNRSQPWPTPRRGAARAPVDGRIRPRAPEDTEEQGVRGTRNVRTARSKTPTNLPPRHPEQGGRGHRPGLSPQG